MVYLLAPQAFPNGKERAAWHSGQEADARSALYLSFAISARESARAFERFHLGWGSASTTSKQAPDVLSWGALTPARLVWPSCEHAGEQAQMPSDGDAHGRVPTYQRPGGRERCSCWSKQGN